MRDETRRDVERRLRSVAGHVQGVLRMVESETYCIDLLRQLEAVEQALRKVRQRLLQDHLDTCVTTAIQGRDVKERERVLRELLEVYTAGGRR